MKRGSNNQRTCAIRSAKLKETKKVIVFARILTLDPPVLNVNLALISYRKLPNFWEKDSHSPYVSQIAKPIKMTQFAMKTVSLTNKPKFVDVRKALLVISAKCVTILLQFTQTVTH